MVPLADIVATATTSETPVLQGNWLTAGAHVDLVGAYTVSMREADDHTLQHGALYVDRCDTTVDHIGELLIPLASGAIQPDSVLGTYMTRSRKVLETSGGKGIRSKPRSSKWRGRSP